MSEQREMNARLTAALDRLELRRVRFRQDDVESSRQSKQRMRYERAIADSRSKNAELDAALSSRLAAIDGTKHAVSELRDVDKALQDEIDEARRADGPNPAELRRSSREVGQAWRLAKQNFEMQTLLVNFYSARLQATSQMARRLPRSPRSAREGRPREVRAEPDVAQGAAPVRGGASAARRRARAARRARAERAERAGADQEAQDRAAPPQPGRTRVLNANKLYVKLYISFGAKYWSFGDFASVSDSIDTDRANVNTL
jgi:hypothetical protein